MSYRAPRIPLIENPRNIDKHLQFIQTRLKTRLSWLEASFGRAYVAVDAESRRVPEFYLGNGEYYTLTPNDNLNAFSFLLPDERRDYDEYSIDGGYHSADVSLIVYGNLTAIDSTKNYYFAEELLSETLKVLRGAAGVEIKQSYDTLDTVYRGFDLRDLDVKLLKHPYFGFRILFNLKYLEDC